MPCRRFSGSATAPSDLTTPAVRPTGPKIYSDDGSITETDGPDEPPMSEVLTAVAQLPDAILAFALRE